jgi:hypothetical protein
LSEENPKPAPESGRVYGAVTRYWPRIAVGLVVILGAAEWIIGGLTADTGIEFYLMAWAATTGGLWFLFEKAEVSSSAEARHDVAGWLSSSRGEEIARVPEQFAHLFDRVFGERHLTWRCFRSSALASVSSVITVGVLWIAVFFPITGVSHTPDGVADVSMTMDLASVLTEGLAVGLAVALLVNALPDYLSLLETRLVISLAREGRGLLPLLGLDFAFTCVLSLTSVLVGSQVLLGPISDDSGTRLAGPDLVWDLVTLRPELGDEAYLPVFDRREAYSPVAEEDYTEEHLQVIVDYQRTFEELAQMRSERGLTPSPDPFYYDSFGFPLNGFWRGWVQPGLPFGIFFYSAFFTSVWLWLYAASVIVSRVLVRMGGGVGFLLRATDVEHQPFRSMGFVSVIITSVIFALGLPLVLL